ncbi:MAG: hypothetical protein MJ214_05160 [Bacilli bacterium]|nr:hypothetical protein [Bacilli bacterium]
MSKTFNKSQLKKMGKKTGCKTVSGGQKLTVTTKKRAPYGSAIAMSSAKTAKKRTAYGSTYCPY